jgi:GAF domain-containing protein
LRTELPTGTLLAVNVSPDALPLIAAAGVWPDDLCGVIVEVTEQAVENPASFGAQLDILRARGAAIAIDDVSTGYAGLLRLAELRPDYVKIDRQVVAGVGDSVVQAAVLEALVTLSHRLGAAVIGEGVENLADLGALGDFDVDYAQGYAVARPSAVLGPIRPAVVAACRTSRRQLLRGSSVTGHAARTRDVYAVTATLAAADHQHDVDVAIAATAADLDVDVIGVSILTSARTIREIATTEPTIDTTIYSLARYPATRAVLEGAETVEIQLTDPLADTAERVLMQRLGRASLLLVPIYDLDRAIGFLEFAQRTPRRWNAQDVAHAQGLAEHLGRVLPRLGVGAVGVDVAAC